MARPCHHSKSPVYKHTSCIKVSKRNLEGPVKVPLLKWKLNLSLVRFLGKSWQLFCCIMWTLGMNSSQHMKTLYIERRQTALCHLLPRKLYLLKVICCLFMQSEKCEGRKKTQSQTLTVLKILQTQD